MVRVLIAVVVLNLILVSSAQVMQNLTDNCKVSNKDSDTI